MSIYYINNSYLELTEAMMTASKDYTSFRIFYKAVTCTNPYIQRNIAQMKIKV